jgi:hypothetical protein
MIISEGHCIGFPLSSFCSFVKDLSCREQTVYNQDVGVMLIVLNMYLRGGQVVTAVMLGIPTDVFVGSLRPSSQNSRIILQSENGHFHPNPLQSIMH